ncbi:MAG: hypothetical protein HZA31_08560 [Opitutae bacterium]|nr:hypothetical protein [Opitutae bacterium]
MHRLNTVNALDYGLIALYFGVVIWVGFYSAKKNRGTRDFFRAGEDVPWFMAGISAWVTGFSAFMFIAAAGEIYRSGASAVLLFTCAFWAYLGGYFYFAAAWRRTRIAAPLEFLTRRFSGSTTYFYSVMFIPLGIVGIGSGLYTISLFVSSALGLDREVFALAGLSLSGLQLCIVIIGAVMILYTAMGGLWAAVLSDSIQSLIVLIMSLLLLPISLHYLGHGNIFAGLERMVRELPTDYLLPHTGGRGLWFIAAYIVFNFVLYNAGWHQAQRYNSVPGERDSGRMAMLCAWLSLFGPLLWILPVMTARLIFPDIAALWPNVHQPEEVAFVSLALLLLPHGMIGFVVAAIVSTALGKANDSFNWLSASVARDIYVPVRRKLGHSECADLHQMRVAQVTMVVLGILGMGVALYIANWGKGIFNFVLVASSLTDIPLYTPVLLGMMFRRTPWWSGIAASCAGLLACLVLAGLGVWPQNSGYERNVFGGLLASTLTFFLSALWFRTDDPRNAEILRLDADMRTPVVAPAGAAGYGALPMYRVIGNISIGLAAVMFLCWGLPSVSTPSPGINALAGSLLLILGLVLRRVSRGTRPPAGGASS